MMRTAGLFCIFCFLLSCAAERERVDLLIYNARIYTVDSSFTVAEAMAIDEGKVVATGTAESLRKNFAAEEELNLEQRAVYPGFIDAHCHFINQAESLRRVNLFGTTSYREIIERTLAFQKENQLDFIAGRGWDQNDWEVKDFPDKAALDSAFPHTPVALTRVDGHAILLNQAALDYAGIDENSSVEGGIFMKNAEGKLSGVLIDNAIEFLEIPRLSKADLIAAVQQTEEICLSYGLTGLHDAGLSWAEIDFLDSLEQAEMLHLKFYLMISAIEEDVMKAEASRKIDRAGFRVNSYKFYADGALGSRGACLLHPYHDKPDQYGLLLNSREYFEKAAGLLAREGYQMNTHAIGDSANRMMLDIYHQFGGASKRWRIEHAQVVNENDFSLFGEYEVIPSVQPTHATSDMYWAGERLGSQRLKDAYAYKKLLQQYGQVALGTDFPIEDISTLKTFYAACIRKDASGYPAEGFQMENALSREEALRGMTIWAAYAAFEENEKGSLEKGKAADFIVMDRDIMQVDEKEIPGAQVLQTYIDGKLRYSR